MVTFSGVPSDPSLDKTHAKLTLKDDVWLHHVSGFDDSTNRYLAMVGVKGITNLKVEIKESESEEGAASVAKLIVTGDPTFSRSFKLDPKELEYTAGVTAKLTHNKKILIVALPKRNSEEEKSTIPITVLDEDDDTIRSIFGVDHDLPDEVNA
mmetsp:Transcript_43323/g.64225  ORF Transcript_43323/g.64225 Transcript_43323/m.64225 type:complete len:153 (-) Transcript_43323:196-654(-)|eukprot:CAMPEP_0194035952 /NCGR_PEP_ID=MMETSP0009_2-20130614/8363_1 /TAXON_ID=210454 /ORGANISM="Grammatophora oceanica, Strain CCMP 410" /LENGTH=152 /DNA_ID=CAMNT_0038677525 /DNA_START=174 /DNA_END=632 /DNA_ORIENTATION=-